MGSFEFSRLSFWTEYISVSILAYQTEYVGLAWICQAVDMRKDLKHNRVKYQ